MKIRKTQCISTGSLQRKSIKISGVGNSKIFLLKLGQNV